MSDDAKTAKRVSSGSPADSTNEIRAGRLRGLRIAARNLAVLASAAFAVLTAARFVDFDNLWLLGLVAVVPLLLAMSILAVGVLSGRRFAVVSLALVVLVAVLALPGTIVPRFGCTVRALPQSGSVTVMSHNVLFSNSDPAALLAQIERVNPDVLLLQETSWERFSALYPELSDRYGFVTSSGVQYIVSRWELSDQFEAGTSTGGAVVASVDTPLGLIRIANVHPSAPTTLDRRAAQRMEYQQMQAWRESESVDVLMGDFNAGASHAIYRSLLSDGYVDAHREAGCGTGLTWSPNVERIPAALSLDHALVNQRLSVETFEVLDFAGSDHKAIAVELSFE